MTSAIQPSDHDSPSLGLTPNPFQALQSQVPHKAAQIWLHFSFLQFCSCSSTMSQILDAILVFLGCSWGTKDQKIALSAHLGIPPAQGDAWVPQNQPA